MSTPINPRLTIGVRNPSGGPSSAISIPLPDPIRTMGFMMGAGLLFLRVSLLHQAQYMLMGFNLHLLYLVGIPALLGLFLGGGIPRTFRGRPAVYWTGFAVCMVIAIPFSAWGGGSARLAASYFSVDFIMLFILGGMVVSWREFRVVMWVLAWAAGFNLLTARLFLKTYGDDRVSGGVGSIGDPNDFAVHLLLVLPFLLWVTLNAKSFAIRFAAILGVAYGCLLILSTGSRGGLVGMAASVLFFMFWATTSQRWKLLFAMPIGLLVIVSVVPVATLRRITSFSPSDEASGEAIASGNARRYLFNKSIEYTLAHPFVGVGPGQFPLYEGQHNRFGGSTHGYWHQTHNTFTQVSSECGIPAALFFLAGIISTFTALNSTYRRVNAKQGCEDIRSTAFCVMLGMSGFCVGIFFLSFAYFVYLPALGGLAISMSSAARDELLLRRRRSHSPSTEGNAEPRGSLNIGSARRKRESLLYREKHDRGYCHGGDEAGNGQS
jgi:O-antigen ligase